MVKESVDKRSDDSSETLCISSRLSFRLERDGKSIATSRSCTIEEWKKEREREEEGKTERSSRKKFDTGSKYPDRSTLSIKSIRDNTIPRLTSFAISEPAFFPVASLIKRKVIRGPSNFDGNDFFLYLLHR